MRTKWYMSKDDEGVKECPICGRLGKVIEPDELTCGVCIHSEEMNRQGKWVMRDACFFNGDDEQDGVKIESEPDWSKLTVRMPVLD